MTATEVNGLRVVSDEPTPSPYLHARDGTPLIWSQTRTLLLEDGSIVYGCAHCEFTTTNPNSVRPHLGKHNRRRPRQVPGPANGKVDPATRLADGLSVADLLRSLQQLEELQADRDAWKARARAAERSLNALRKALTP